MATAGQPTNKPEYCEFARGAGGCRQHVAALDAAGESMRNAGD
jgi:hypothetical protein